MTVNQAAVSRLIMGLETLRGNAGGYCGYEKALEDVYIDRFVAFDAHPSACPAQFRISVSRTLTIGQGHQTSSRRHLRLYAISMTLVMCYRASGKLCKG